MIAASDPQEFIPGGRQQALRHPGPPESSYNIHGINVDDDHLLHRLEKVSISEHRNTEWWAIRRMPELGPRAEVKKPSEDVCDNDRTYGSVDNKSHSEYLFEDSWSFKSFEPNASNRRMPDMNTSKFFRSRKYSNEPEIKSESKSSNKSISGHNSDSKNVFVKFKSNIGYMEEELYVNGNTVVWSKGLSYNEDDQSRTTICCYTSHYPVKQAQWCTFYSEHPEFANIANPMKVKKEDEPIGEPLQCVCIVDAQNLRVYTADNEDFTVTLPIQVSKVWNTKFGIILEKELDDQNKDIPTSLFSLIHPLDDISSLAISNLGQTHVIEDSSNIQIVFTSVEPSLCMAFDKNTGQHSVYKIRRVRSEEISDMNSSALKHAGTSAYITSNKNKNSILDPLKNILQPCVSPFGSSRATSVTSAMSHFTSRNPSPMASVSRCHTPVPSSNSTSPWLLRLSRLQGSVRVQNNTSAISKIETDAFQMYKPADPQFCLEHIWTESNTVLQEGVLNGPATNVFLSDDLTGQQYLCYFVASRAQLSLVKFDNTNCMIIGMLTSISAKDAVAIPHLHMFAILEHSANVVLYSGMTLVGKLHIGGALAQHVPSPYAVKKNLKNLNASFPRRSSLLPNSVADPRFEEHLLSPVLPALSSKNTNMLQLPLIAETYNLGGDSSNIYLCGLRDAVEDRITLKYSDGSYYRVRLPGIVASPLIESCLNVLRQTMQRDATITLLTRWYSLRNSPGSSNLTIEAEWTMFSNLLLDLLGYENESSGDVKIDNSTTPSCAAKRKRQSTLGSDSDWKFLQRSSKHEALSNNLSHILHLKKDSPKTFNYKNNEVHVNTSSILFPYIKIIHYSLHLLYEDLKLNVLRNNELPLLASFLSLLSNDLGLKYYAMHYWRDFSGICSVYNDRYNLTASDLKHVTPWPVINEKPDSILEYLYDLLRGEQVDQFPVIGNVNTRTKNIVKLCVTYTKGNLTENLDVNDDNAVKVIAAPGFRVKASSSSEKTKHNYTKDTAAQKVVIMMTEMFINTRDLESYPMAINFILHEVLWQCRENPPSDWPPEAYHLLQRPDLASQAQIIDVKKQSNAMKNKYTMFSQINDILPIINQVVEGEQEDGMEEVDGSLLKLRFPDDLRVAETRRLLQSSKPVPIVLVQRPDVSDHDFIEEQEKHLYAICTRTMSLPVGRGMFTLRTATPVITEPLPIPPLCLTGKAPPRGTTVELTHIDTPPNMNLWPLYHNGVANGLRIDPDAKNIDSTWIVFNKPKTSVETLMEHAGFLMALGLNGHLKNLAVLMTFDYLVKFHEMTSVGVLLGLSSAFRATSNTVITKMLSVHIESLLPPTSMELDVPQNLQVAALLGIGLVYQSTAHRHMMEVLLTEIGRPPGPEMENSVDRESYSLAAGLALGLVTLRKGGRQSGLSDLNVTDTLHYYMVGGNKRPLLGSQKEKYKVPSFQIREGSSVNLDITAPGATLALGLMYFGSDNAAIADWMAPPDTQYLLDFVRPDFLMLRILSRALILWNHIEPEKSWIEKQVPESIKPHCMVRPSILLDVDYEAMNQAYCNIIAGACFALGLKYAGSANEVAFQTLLEYCNMFTSLTSKSIAELAGKPTIETCLNVVLLSVSMVMAGTGNLEIMRIVRFLRRRVGLASSAVVTYGSHLAIHMALGLLFLGGGRYTLSNSPPSVAALICAFYPKFPTHSNDNRYHLQAFRHLYVLAVEPRLVIPRDITMGRMCYANICVIKLDGTAINLRGPGLIPDLNTLYKVSIKDERYWPVVFERERNWDQLLKLLSSCCCIDVKQRAGCLSYSEDKSGFRSELARTLTQSEIVPWDPPAKTIVSFSSDCIVKNFTDHFLQLHTLNNPGDSEEVKLKQNFTRATYDCVVKDKLSVLPLFINLIKIIHGLSVSLETLELWHLKIICSFVLKNKIKSTLTNPELILSLYQQALTIIDNWEPQLRTKLKSYILGSEIDCDDTMHQLAKYVTFYNVPYNFGGKGEELLEVMCKLNSLKMDSETVDKVLRMLDYVR